MTIIFQIGPKSNHDSLPMSTYSITSTRYTVLALMSSHAA
nr:MAG TPA: hypothetical protein [Caudoviricetes sp.]